MMERIRLNGNQLKIIALVAMTLDHMGEILFPGQIWLKIIGRLSFPIFAYMIAEGCRYTRNKARYLGLLLGEGLVLQLVFFLVTGGLLQGILITFSLSILLIYTMEGIQKERSADRVVCFVLVLAVVVFLTVVLPRLWKGRGFAVDYGICGVLAPALVYVGRNRMEKLGLLALGLVFLSLSIGGIQYFCLLALPLLWLYDGSRGKRKMKYLFYIYYPLHLAVLYGIAMIR